MSGMPATTAVRTGGGEIAVQIGGVLSDPAVSDATEVANDVAMDLAMRDLVDPRTLPTPRPLLSPQPPRLPEATPSVFPALTIGNTRTRTTTHSDTNPRIPITFASAGRTMKCPESAGAIDEVLAGLHSMIRSDSPLAGYYGEVEDEITSAIALAHRVRALGYPQRLTASLCQLHASLVEFPISYINRVAHYGTGGCSSSIYAYDAKFFENAKVEFESRYGYAPEPKYLKTFAREYVTGAAKRSLTFDKKFLVDGISQEECERKQFFQYKYIYRIGEVPFIDFIETRETGSVFVGIKNSTDGAHDGQHGTTSSFEDHDYFHAHFQKLQDRRLFDSLGITTIKDAVRLKRANQRQVEVMLDELRRFTDPVHRKQCIDGHLTLLPPARRLAFEPFEGGHLYEQWVSVQVESLAAPRQSGKQRDVFTARGA